MRTVGLTGGIGSGKTTIAHFFQDLGIPVYFSDTRAKTLMENQVELRRKIIDLFGEEAYTDGALNRPFLAQAVFSNPELLKKLNAVVHPAVRADFMLWKEAQDAPYVIQEAAILFENGGYKNLDYTVLVVAPEQEREKRVMLRDGLSKSEVQSRIRNQWTDKQKRPLADFIIENTDLEQSRLAVLKIHECLLHSP